MSKWSKQKDREDGAWEFLRLLDKNKSLRKECRQDPAKAKEKLIEAGGFADMPGDVELRVLENRKSDMDNLIVMVLPPFGKLSMVSDIHDVWVCCWHLWPKNLVLRKVGKRFEGSRKAKGKQKPNR